MVIQTSTGSSGGARKSRIIKKHQSSGFFFSPPPSRAVKAARLASANTYETVSGPLSEEDVDDDDSSFFGSKGGGEEERSGAGNNDVENPSVKKPDAATLRRPSSGAVYAIYEPEYPAIFVHSVVIICFIVMLLELYVHGLDRDLKTDPCPLKFWNFCFERVDDNAMLGPSAATLLKMGAKTGHKIVVEKQSYRLFTCMWLHGGLLHYLFNMMALYQLGIGIEQSYGSTKIFIIYLFSGLFGSVTSTIFTPESVGVGASGAIFGLFGAAWGDLIQNWDLYDSPCSTIISLSFGTLLNLGIGTAPLLDNFAHFSGMVMGIIMSFGLLVVERQTSSGRRLGQKYYSICLEFVPVVTVPIFMCGALGVLFAGIRGHEVCKSCTAINCIPFPWGCDVHTEGECVWDCSTCASSGVTADITLYNENINNATVTLHCPVLSDWTKNEFLDVVLKGEDVNGADSHWLLGKCKQHCPDAFF